jgi:hypothetical protein
MSRRYVTAAVALVMIAACDAGKPRMSGGFTLRLIGGQPLPAQAITGVSQTTLVDTLDFIAELSAKQNPQAEYRWSYQDANATVHTGIFRESYSLANGVVSFFYECPMGADCIDPPHTGTMRGDTLVVTWGSPQYRTKEYVRFGR